MLVALPQGIHCGLTIVFYIILVYFHNTHQMLVGLPKGDNALVGLVRLFILFVLFIV